MKLINNYNNMHFLGISNRLKEQMLEHYHDEKRISLNWQVYLSPNYSKSTKFMLYRYKREYRKRNILSAIY